MKQSELRLTLKIDTLLLLLQSFDQSKSQSLPSAEAGEVRRHLLPEGAQDSIAEFRTQRGVEDWGPVCYQSTAAILRNLS